MNDVARAPEKMMVRPANTTTSATQVARRSVPEEKPSEQGREQRRSAGDHQHAGDGRLLTAEMKKSDVPARARIATNATTPKFLIEEQQHRVEESLRAASELEGVIRTYLSLDHLKSPACGCPSAALLPEVARQSTPTRQAYEDGINSYLLVLAPLIPEADAAVANRRATAIFALMVGTLQYARAVTDIAAAEQILESGVEAALLLARAPSA